MTVTQEIFISCFNPSPEWAQPVTTTVTFMGAPWRITVARDLVPNDKIFMFTDPMLVPRLANLDDYEPDEKTLEDFWVVSVPKDK